MSAGSGLLLGGGLLQLAPLALLNRAHVRRHRARPGSRTGAVHTPDLSHRHATLRLVLPENTRQITHTSLLGRIAALTVTPHNPRQIILLLRRVRGRMRRFIADNRLHQHGIYPVLRRRRLNHGAQIRHRIGRDIRPAENKEDRPRGGRGGGAGCRRGDKRDRGQARL